jgi:hypothetical protein
MIFSAVTWSIQAMWIIYWHGEGNINNLPIIIGITQILAGILLFGLLICGIALIQTSKKN